MVEIGIRTSPRRVLQLQAASHLGSSQPQRVLVGRAGAGLPSARLRLWGRGAGPARLTKLRLSLDEMTPYIPSTVSNLPHLEVLHLSGNHGTWKVRVLYSHGCAGAVDVWAMHTAIIHVVTLLCGLAPA